MTEKIITRVLLFAAVIFAVSRIPNGLQAEPPAMTVEATTFGEPALAEVRLFAGNFAPRGWAFCHGQLLSINDNQALFSLVGTTYGGDGRTTFALPDLRGRTVLGSGSGPGLSPLQLGQKMGTSTATVRIAPTTASSGSGGQAAPPTKPANEGQGQMTGARPDGQSGVSTNPVPSNQTIDLHQPGIGLNYIIALQGIYPSRS